MKIRGCTKSIVGTGEITMDYAKGVFAELLAFQGYGFCKSHAVAYSVYSAVQLWLEDKYFLEYMCVLLSHVSMKNDKKNSGVLAERIEYCVKHGARVLYPDIQRSEENWSIVPGGGLLASLKNIKSMSDRDVEIILAGRPYADLKDFLDRTGFNESRFKTLLFSRALDCFADSAEIATDSHLERMYNWYYGTYLRKPKKDRSAVSASLFPELDAGEDEPSSAAIPQMVFSRQELEEKCRELNGFVIPDNVRIRYHEYFERGLAKVAETKRDESYAVGNRRICTIAEALESNVGEDKYRSIWLLAKVVSEVRGIKGKFGDFDKITVSDGSDTAVIFGNSIPAVFRKGTVLVFPVSVNDKGRIYVDKHTLEKKDACVLENAE